jgi:hypothetical protein
MIAGHGRPAISDWETHMKSISASIIVGGGLATIVAGVYHHHSDTGIFVSAVGIIAALAGLAGRIKTLREP